MASKNIKYQVRRPLRSLYNAAVKQLWGLKLLNPIFLAVYFVVVIGLLVALYPLPRLLGELNKEKKPDVVGMQYLKQLLYYNKKHKQYKLLLADQELKHGYLRSALSIIKPLMTSEPQTESDWRASYLYFSYLKIKTFAARPGTPAREKYVAELNKVISGLITGPYHYSEFVDIANTALAIENSVEASRAYAKILTLSPEYTVKSYVDFAKKALSVGNYTACAGFYFLAQKKSVKVPEKKKYFLAALRALQSGNMLEQALKAAEANIGVLSNDKEVLLFLTKLSLAANKPEFARKHIAKVIKHE